MFVLTLSSSDLVALSPSSFTSLLLGQYYIERKSNNKTFFLNGVYFFLPCSKCFQYFQSVINLLVNLNKKQCTERIWRINVFKQGSTCTALHSAYHKYTKTWMYTSNNCAHLTVHHPCNFKDRGYLSKKIYTHCTP